MDITLGIRRRQLKPEYTGHSEPATLVRDGEAVLNTATAGVITPPTIADWPQAIALHFAWEPQPILNRDVFAISCLAEQTYGACGFYDPTACNNPVLAANSIYGGIDLIYQGVGAYWQSNKQFNFTGLNLGDAYKLADVSALHKPFIFQDSGTLRVERQSLPGGDWHVIPPKRSEFAATNLGCLLGYGVYAKPGCAIEDIEQIYAIITHGDGSTKLQLWRQSDLTALHIGPPDGGKYQGRPYRFIDAVEPSQHASLAGLIADGGLRISLTRDDGVKTYISSTFQQFDPASQTLIIRFVQQ